PGSPLRAAGRIDADAVHPPGRRVAVAAQAVGRGPGRGEAAPELRRLADHRHLRARANRNGHEQRGKDEPVHSRITVCASCWIAARMICNILAQQNVVSSGGRQCRTFWPAIAADFQHICSPRLANSCEWWGEVGEGNYGGGIKCTVTVMPVTVM